MTGLPANRLHPKVRLIWTAATAFGGLVATVAIGLLWVVGVPAWALVVPAIAVWGAALWFPRAAYDRWRYEIRERDVFISKGVLLRSLVLMPFDRIQFVETKQGPLDRWFGLTQLLVRTAGGEVSIPGLNEDEAGRLRERLSAVVGTLSV